MYTCQVEKDSSDKDSDMHCLDQLEETLNIYSLTHAVFIVGDITASLISRKGNLQDTLLRDFVDRNALYWKQHGEETFFHPNKTDRAEIDYIFFSKTGEN